MIVTHLRYSMPSLRACTLTCRSWYIAAVPHIHHNLFIDNSWDRNFHWPNILQQKYALGVLPFVKTLWVRGVGAPAFSPMWFDTDILRQFSALSNLRRLMIDHLDIPSFMPQI